MFRVNALSQNDPAWKNQLIGTGSVTIGWYGCLLTDLVMVVNGFGEHQTPLTLNKLMVDTPRGYQGANIVPQHVPDVLPNIRFISFVRCPNDPAPIDDINAAIANNKPVIVEVDNSFAPGLQAHWVVIYDRQGDNYLIADPWPWPLDTKPVLLTERYGNGATPSVIITGVIFMDANIVPVPPPVPTLALPEKKGVFLWQLGNAANGDMAALANILAQDGYNWVAIKATDGVSEYNFSKMPSAIQELRKVGINVWGWQYCYGYNPVAEGNMAVTNITEHGFAGWLIDAESEYEVAGSNHNASRYMDILRSSYPNYPVGLCSFRYPYVHQSFPWATFLARCDFHAPQVYWVEAHNPVTQLQRSVNELKALRNIPIIPVGPAYYEDGWQPTVAEINEFYKAVRELGLPGVCWWSWDSSGIQDNPAFREAIAAMTWDPPAPPATVPLAQWAKEADKYLRTVGYKGPQPE